MIVYKTQNNFYNSNIVINKSPRQLLRFRNIFVVRKSLIIRIVNIWIAQETSVLKTKRQILGIKSPRLSQQNVEVAIENVERNTDIIKERERARYRESYCYHFGQVRGIFF